MTFPLARAAHLTASPMVTPRRAPGHHYPPSASVQRSAKVSSVFHPAMRRAPEVPTAVPMARSFSSPSRPNLNEKIDQASNTRLHVAVKLGLFDEAVTLLKLGHSPNTFDVAGWTPLDSAENPMNSGKDKNLIDLLKAHGALPARELCRIEIRDRYKT